MTYDGTHVCLWLNGARATRTELAKCSVGAASFWIGADPGAKKPGSFCRGQIDEVRISRISRVARYAKRFKPDRAHAPDRDTLLLLHFDTDADGRYLDALSHFREVVAHGAPRVVKGHR
jgi:hypothetical protein